MGKESASIGQGKALKAGWITKDKDLLKAKVVSPKACPNHIPEYRTDGLYIGGVDSRYQ